MSARVRVGTSGYQYDDWRGRFYPRDLPKRRWFEYYAQHFDTVEINNTFYHLPAARTFDAWHDVAPRGFLYALKFSRYATHLKRLKDPEGPLEHFVDRAQHLGPFLGPILVQLPPGFHAHAERLAGFLDVAPADRCWAVEFRHDSWLCDEVYAILEQHRAALCVHDMLREHPRRVTAAWTYLRFHGDHDGGSYSPQFLSALARRIRGTLAQGIDVYAYFNNDVQGYAVCNALDLKRYLALA